MSRSIVVEFLGKDKTLGSAVADADRKTSKLGATMAKVGKAAALGLAAGGVIAGRALFDMTKNAIEDEAAQRKLAIGLKNATGATDSQVAAVEKWIAAQGRALGVTDDELRPAFQRLVEATGSVKEAQRQMGIAMDVSAGTGKSLKTVSEALMKANNGTTASLSKLGLKTKDANGEALSLDEALKKMSETFGGQAAAKAGTLEGKLDRLKLIFDETKETIGAKMIPVLEDFADWFLRDGIPLLAKFGAALQDVGRFVVSTAKFVDRHKVALTALAATIAAVVVVTKIHAAVMAAQAAGGLAKLIKGIPIVTKLTKAWAAVQWLMNAALTANPIGIVVAAIALLVAGVVIAYKRSETFRKIVDGAFRAIAAAGKWMWNNVLQPVFKYFAIAIGKVITFFGKMLQVIGQVPKMGWVGDLGDKLVGAGGKATDLANKIRDIPDAHNTKITVDDSDARNAFAWLNGELSKPHSETVDMFVDWHDDGPGDNPLIPGPMRTTGGRVPISSTGTKAAAFAGRASSPRGGLQINFNGLVTDPRAVGREIVRVLREYQESTGRPLPLGVDL